MAIGKKIQACFREMFLCCTGWDDAEQQQERPLVIVCASLLAPEKDKADLAHRVVQRTFVGRRLTSRA